MEIIKRNWLSSLVLLLVNGAALACVAFAVGEGVFSDNALVAAFPALLAFLLTFWQPWLFFLCLLPGGPHGAVLYAVPVTLVIYRTEPGQCFLQRLREFARRLGPKTVSVCAAGFALVGTSITLSAYKDFPVRHHGLPPASMLPVKIEGGVSSGKAVPPYFLTDSRYYPLARFIDDEHLWRVRVPRQQLPALVKTLALQRASMENLPERFWKQPPYWWANPGGSLEAYQTPDANINTKRGEGWHANAVYDSQAEFLYVWGENNF